MISFSDFAFDVMLDIQLEVRSCHFTHIFVTVIYFLNQLHWGPGIRTSTVTKTPLLIHLQTKREKVWIARPLCARLVKRRKEILAQGSSYRAKTTQ